MRVYGLTGSIASGKSVVASFLEPYWPVIDADQVSRDVVRPGAPGLEAVAAAFGAEVLLPNGSLDRAGLRQMIAVNEERRRQLNGILHPLIAMEIQRRLGELAAEGHALAIVSAALMLETGSFRNYEKVILVCSPAELRLQRLLARDGMDESSARSLMASQMPEQEKRGYADAVIENRSDLACLAENTWRAMASLGWSRPDELK